MINSLLLYTTKYMTLCSSYFYFSDELKSGNINYLCRGKILDRRGTYLSYPIFFTTAFIAMQLFFFIIIVRIRHGFSSIFKGEGGESGVKPDTYRLNSLWWIAESNSSKNAPKHHYQKYLIFTKRRNKIYEMTEAYTAGRKNSDTTSATLSVHCRENGPQFQFTSGDAIKLARDRAETNKWISLICVLVILFGSVGLVWGEKGKLDWVMICLNAVLLGTIKIIVLGNNISTRNSLFGLKFFYFYMQGDFF